MKKKFVLLILLFFGSYVFADDDDSVNDSETTAWEDAGEDITDNSMGDIGDEAYMLASRYMEAQAALNFAKANDELFTNDQMAALQQAVDDAKSALDEFCEEYNFQYEYNAIRDTFSVYDAHGKPVTRIGDPVILTSGIFVINTVDYDLKGGKAEFQVRRNHFSETDLERLEKVPLFRQGFFGYGWNSNLESRIIKGSSVKKRIENAPVIDLTYFDRMQEDEDYNPEEDQLSPAMEYYKTLLKTKRDVAGYYQEDSECQEFMEEINLMLENFLSSVKTYDGRTQTQQDAVYQGKITEERQLTSYGIAGYLSESLGEDRLIFVDDAGNPFVFTFTDGEYVSEKASQAGIFLKKNEITGQYEVFFLNGEKRFYSSSGLPEYYVNKHNGITRFFFDSEGRLLKLSLDDCAVLNFSYQGERISRIWDERGEIKYDYTNDQLFSVDSGINGVIKYSYLSNKRLYTQKKADGKTVYLSYVQKGDRNVINEVKNEEKYKEGFYFDFEGRKTTYKDFDDNLTQYFYNEQGKVTRIVHPDKTVENYTYNSDETVSSYSSDSTTIRFSYDSKKRQTKAIYQDQTSEEWQYDDLNLIRYKDRAGIVTEFNYDVNNFPVSYYRNGKQIFLWTRDSNGNITEQTDCRGNKIQYSFDAKGKILKRGKESWEYYSDGKLKSYTDGAGIKHQYSYSGRTVIDRTSGGLEISVTYNPRGTIACFEQKDLLTGEERNFEYEYNGLKKLEKVFAYGKDREGKNYPKQLLEERNYSGTGKLVKIFNPETAATDDGTGWRREFSYDYYGNISSVTNGSCDSGGNYVDFCRVDSQFVYEPGRISQLSTYSDGTETVEITDDMGNLKEFWKNNELVEHYELAEGGLKISEKRTGSEKMEYSYTDAFLTEIKEGIPGGMKINFEYYPDGIIKSFSDYYGNETVCSYDQENRISQVSDHFLIRKISYDSEGRKILDEKRSKNGKLMEKNQWKYEDNGRKIHFIEGDLYETVIQVNGFGDVIGKTFADGSEWNFVYDNLGRLIKQQNHKGEKFCFWYDGKDNLVKILEPEGREVFYRYDFNGNLIKIEEKNRIIFQAEYDLDGNIISCYQAPFAYTQQFSYSADKKVNQTKINGIVLEKYERSSDGKEISIIDSNNRVRQIITDGYGKVCSSVDRLGNFSWVEFDSKGRPEHRKDYAGNRCRYEYSEDQLKTTIHYDDGTFTVEEKDELGRIVSIQNENDFYLYEYNLAGQLIKVTDQNNGIETLYEYDSAGRLRCLQNDKRKLFYDYEDDCRISMVSDDLTGIKISFSYDKNGRETEIKYSTGEKLLQYYDEYGRLVLKCGYDNSENLCFVNGVVYDEHGRIKLLLDSDFLVTEYAYDELSRLKMASYSYCDEFVSYFRQLCQSSGVNDYSDIKVRTVSLTVQDYQKLLELCQMTPSFSNQIQITFPVIQETFEYDLNGNLTARNTPCGRIEYVYDAENRLIQWGMEGHAEYDKNGNLILRQDCFKSENFVWNQRNQLVSGAATDRLSGNTEFYDFRYDGFGRRTHIETSGQGALHISYDGLTFRELISEPVYSELDKAGFNQEKLIEDVRYAGIDPESYFDTVDLKKYLEGEYKISCQKGGSAPFYSPSGNLIFFSRIADLTGSGQNNVLFQDKNGTVVKSVDETGVVFDYGYDSFGRQVFAGGECDFAFNGKRLEKGINSYDYGFRFYDPSSLRFFSQDPAAAGLNWYSYCASDPVNFTDPDGRELVIPKDGAKQDYEGLMIGSSSTTVASEGCLVVAMAEVLSEILGIPVSTVDVATEISNFLTGSKADNMNYAGVSHNYLADVTKSESLFEFFTALEAAMGRSDKTGIIIQATYGGGKGSYHFVGVTGVPVTIGGVLCVPVSKTSLYDTVTKGSIRYADGWRTINGKTYVPVWNIHGFVQVRDGKNN